MNAVHLLSTSAPVLGASVPLNFAPWLITVLCLLIAAMYTSLCRRALDVFSRKKLLEVAPEERQDELKSHLDRQEEYLSSLRIFDLILRLALVLSLVFGFLAAPESWSVDHGTTVLEWSLLAVLILLGFVLFLEIIPSVLARVRTESWVLRSLWSLSMLHKISSPFRAMFSAIVDAGVTVLGGKLDRPSVDALEEEILSVAEEGGRDGLLASRDIDMIGSIITFGETRVSEVLTPRTEMVCLDVDDDFQVSLRKAIDCGHSRIPVYKDSKDNIIGNLYVKDLLKHRNSGDGTGVDLRRLVRQPHYVQSTKKIGELLQEFKAKRFHMAIVRDEHGGTTGLITIEDIIEEIVGEIYDEFEPEETNPVKHLAPGLVEVDAKVHIDELNEALGLSIPEDTAYETVGGFLFSQMGRIPGTGETYEFKTLRFRVTAADDRRISKLVIHLPDSLKATPEVVADT